MFPIIQVCIHSVSRSFFFLMILRLSLIYKENKNFIENKATGKMKPGHVFTIEPMINLGTWRDQHWSDKWTAVTADGKRSAQFEHTLLVTETGVEILTAGVGERRFYPEP